MFERLLNRFVPSPSAEFDAFMDGVARGDNSAIPSYGINGIVDYYGKNKDGAEQGRYRIPMGQTERSFHVRRENDGIFTITDEGLFPFDGK